MGVQQVHICVMLLQGNFKKFLLLYFFEPQMALVSLFAISGPKKVSIHGPPLPMALVNGYCPHKNLSVLRHLNNRYIKGIVQPFELGSVTSLIQSAVRFCKAGHFQKKKLMIQSHERSLKQNSAA